MNKPKRGVVFAALLAIVLLAGAVCALHWVNAVSLRGTANLTAYTLTDGAAQNLVPVMEDPWVDRGVLHIRGALLRLDQPVGEVKVRVGLIPERIEDGNAQQAATLLNTQMERRYELAQEYGCDDHCGFHASVAEKYLEKGNVQYRVVLVDETDGAKRMITTGMTVTLIEGGLAFVQKNAPEEEAHHAR